MPLRFTAWLPSPREGRVVREDPMVKHSPHKRWKGHDQLCNSHKDDRRGDTQRTPLKVLRKLGVSRRYSRNRVYGSDES